MDRKVRRKVDELFEMFGKRCLTGEGDLARNAIDQVGDNKYAQRPIAVVRPTSAAEVVSLVRWANKTATPITPRGGGSGLAGAAVPVAGGVVCSFAEMSRIINIDVDNLMVDVEPGVVTNALDKALEPHGLFFAGYPMSEDVCFVGGNVAENAGGGRAVKYGVTGTYVLGAEVVTGAGQVLHLGGPRLKDVSGYNLLPLFVGSEGTLGLFTKITLRVIPRPELRGVVLAAFPTADRATDAVSALRGSATVYASSIEFVDGPTARSTNAGMPASAQTEIPADSDALLLVEIEGDSGSMERDLARAEKLLQDYDGTIVSSGSRPEASEKAWRLRKQVPWFVKRSSGEFHSLEDVVVPPAAIPRLVSFVDELRGRHGLPIAVFGHAGDGNFHVTPMKPGSLSEADWPGRLDVCLRELYDFVLGIGGAISGEHGIGRKRVHYLEQYHQAAQLDAMRGLKRLFDPNGILNPGVVLAAEAKQSPAG